MLNAGVGTTTGSDAGMAVDKLIIAALRHWRQGKARAAPKLRSSSRSVKRQVAAAAAPNVNASRIRDSVHERKRQKKGARVRRKVCPDPKCAIIITSRGTHADGCRFKAFRGRAKVTRDYKRQENELDAYIREFRTRFASTLPPSQSPSTPAEGTPRHHNL